MGSTPVPTIVTPRMTSNVLPLIILGGIVVGVLGWALARASSQADEFADGIWEQDRREEEDSDEDR